MYRESDDTSRHHSIVRSQHWPTQVQPTTLQVDKVEPMGRRFDRRAIRWRQVLDREWSRPADETAARELTADSRDHVRPAIHCLPTTGDTSRWSRSAAASTSRP